MRILGIDPGIARCGWGVIEVQNSKLKVQNYGCVETSPKLTTEQRLLKVHHQIKNVVTRYTIDVLSLEELFFGENVKTAFAVGQARGVVLLAAGEKKLPVAVYTPLQVKIALTGYGRAEKNQVAKMVQTLLKLKTIPKPDDTVDALAIALTHAFSFKASKNT